MLPASGSLIVGVSGGTDSLALLHILNAVRVRLSFDLHVATLDHGLRGDAGADDARFVQTIAQSWGIEVTAGAADVRAFAQSQQIGIEAAARLARYDFLAGVAGAFHATHVAVAHNADDQAETVLFHLLRGSGLTGLAGMSYASPLPGHPALTLIRPLLDIPRADLEAYCRDNNLQPRHDASNADVTYTRNRLRHQIIPVLRDVAPQIERHLRQLADLARVEADFADVSLHQAIDPHVVRTSNRISLPRLIFKQMHLALQRRFVLWAARSIAKGEADTDAEDVGYVHVTAAVDLALRGEVGALAQLSGGLQLRLDYETIVIELDDAFISDDLPLLALGEALPVTIPGETALSANWSLIAAESPVQESGLLAIREESKIILRGRNRGDRFAPLGLGGHVQKISKWMIDHKVPANLRDRLPLLVVDDQIAAIWWKEWKVSENFARTPVSSRVIFVRFHKKF